jgi:uncharacterized protein
MSLDGAFWVAAECFYVGAAEETIFRHGLFALLDRKLGANKALVLSALAFGLAHLINDEPPAIKAIQVATTIAMGAVLAVVYKQKGLWPCIAIHAGYNFFVLWVLPLLAQP